jgi:hypothetical protein
LIDGQINGKEFGYLSHYATEYNAPKDNLQSTLVDVIATIVENIQLYNTNKSNEEYLNIYELENLRVLVGGGVDPGQAILSVGFRRNPTKPGRDSIGLYAVPVISDDRNPTERIPTTHSRDPTEIIWIQWDPTGR